MTDPVRIQLRPLGQNIEVERATPLQDVLFAHGVEFPCGGRGLCKGCKVNVLEGALPATPEDRQKLTPAELEAGWRLSCRARAVGNLTLELAQWEASILTDDTHFEFQPRDGLGLAIDLGTTTLVAQLLDLTSGNVLAVRTALNDQAKHGADIMSRIEFAVADHGQSTLTALIRAQLGEICGDLVRSSRDPREVRSVVIVGNTVMHHLFCGLSVEPLSHVPFEPADVGLHNLDSRSLNWTLPGEPSVHFLPCLGGFVGSDILAGLLATRIHEADSLVALMDLGTNGEIVVGNRHRMLCASTAAGPAFEGARISMGMRAATGAISEVKHLNGSLQCHVLGQSTPRGICGSGLVDAAAVGLDLGWIAPGGRLTTGETLTLSPPVQLNQWDIRELQLAKGAIAAGMRILLQQWGANPTEVDRIYLAGAFGNYINQASARRIGLLSFPPEKIVPAGNTALLGAKLALFGLDQHHGAYPEITRRVQHVSLHEDPAFQETYVEEMTFPTASCL